MTKVSAFSKETFLAVKANPEAFDDDRMLGSFNVGPVVCRIYLNEDDEGFYADSGTFDSGFFGGRGRSGAGKTDKG